MSLKYAPSVIEAENLRIASDYDAQVDLFRKFGIADPGPHLLGHNVILRNPDGRYVMKQRETPVDFTFDNDGHAKCVNRVRMTEVERLGGMPVERLSDRDTMRRVMDNILCQSVEPGEVEAWGNV